ncbi:hypothetical protein [Massilia sp. Root418]|jgi:hypothetical protein|uniref:hypothetical protein n=1 Tax=Massilia sp. Root418 TaxID=1736532 RepID=UPI000AAE9CE7|nr:hypothetical protein [Massilia sp. Root418]
MMNLQDITKKLSDATTALAKADNDLKLEIANAAVDATGIIDPTPASDIVGAGLSIARGDYWGAALSTVSMVPYLGDALAKPAKAVRATKAIMGLEKKVAALTQTVADLTKAKKQAEAAEVAAKEAKIAKEADAAKDAAAKQEKSAAKKGDDCEGCATSTVPAKKLLPDEGKVASYKELINAGSRGDNITPNHIPSAKHMEQHGVSRRDGIAINMEQPVPGTGGRHRETFTYGTQADAKMAPRDALAAGVRDARKIYQKDGLYGTKIREGLQELIEKNKGAHPEVFKKLRKK